jgi:hypothetical protein
LGCDAHRGVANADRTGPTSAGVHSIVAYVEAGHATHACEGVAVAGAQLGTAFWSDLRHRRRHMPQMNREWSDCQSYIFWVGNRVAEIGATGSGGLG